MSVFELVTERVAIRDVLRRFAPDAEPQKQGGLDVYECLTGGHIDEWPSWVDYGESYHCFSCKDHGDAVSLFAALKGMDNGIEAAYLLAEEFGVELPQLDPTVASVLAERRAREEAILEELRAYHANLEDNPAVVEYLEKRGLDKDLRARFLLGTTKEGIGVTIPYLDRRRRPQSIIMRYFDEDPTYKYWPVEDFVGGRRGLMVYGDLPHAGTVPIVEGPFDALAVVATGGCAIALGGSSISESQKRDLEGIVTDRKKLRFVTFLDSDSAGMAAAEELCRRVYPHVRYAAVPFSEIVEGATDPGDLIRDGGPEKVLEALERAKKEAKDFTVILTERIVEETEDELERFETLVDEVLPLVALQPREGTRHVLARQLADMIGKGLVADVSKATKEAVRTLIAERAKSLSSIMAQKSLEEQEAYRRKVEEAQPAIDERLLVVTDDQRYGVLNLLAEEATKTTGFIAGPGDEEALKAQILCVLSSQLDMLTHDKPSTAPSLVTAEAGRGKNYLTDTAVSLVPEELVERFESSSEKNLYYEFLANPNFLKHRFLYPNELEGVMRIREILRPLASQGRAVHRTTIKMGDEMVPMRLVIEGPASFTVPTVENYLDDHQLFTRLLVLELPDYRGRVLEHSRALSKLYSPGFVAENFEYLVFVWNEAIRQLALKRKVVIPGADHEDFGYDSDLSHGARVWGNLLGLVATNTWLEQRHRKTIKFKNGKEAILAEPVDYRLIYGLFETVAGRSIVNVSEPQEKILDAVHELNEDRGWNQRGWEQREVAEKAGISQSTVSRNYKELQQKWNLLDPEAGSKLRLTIGVGPKNWSRTNIMEGFPTPERYAEIWEEVRGDDDPDDDGPDDGGGGGVPPSSPPPPSDGGEENPPETVHTPHIMHDEATNGHNPDKTAVLANSGRAYETGVLCTYARDHLEEGARDGAVPVGVAGLVEYDEEERAYMESSYAQSNSPESAVLSAIEAPVHNIHDMHGFGGSLVTTDKGVLELAEALRDKQRIAFDLEGDLRIPAGREGVRGMAVSGDGVEAFVDFYTVDPSPLLRVLEGEDKKLFVHGAEYDLPALIKFFDFDPKGTIVDTLNMSRAAYPGAFYLTGEYEFERVSHRLEDCLSRELPERTITVTSEAKKKYQSVRAWVPARKKDGTPEEVPEITDGHVEYALSDVRHLADLYDALLERLEEIGQLETFERAELPIGQILPRIMARGVPIDLAAWSSELAKVEREANKLYEKALELAPPHPRKGERKKPNSKTDLSSWEWNFGNYSPKTKEENRQDALRCLQLAGLGDYFDDTRDETLEAYLERHGSDELVETILAYRQTKNLLGRMRNFVKGATLEGRIYTQLHSYGTETGRITTSDKNLAGLDKNGPWRKCLRDPKGESMILRADLDQIELRALARVVERDTGDDSLVSVYRDPLPDGTYEDLHTATARIATGRDDITKDSPERKKAKATNFSIAYGAMPREETAEFFDAFFERAPGVEEWQSDYGNRDDFWTESPLGRKRFVDPYTYGRGRGHPNREQRLNGPIQCGSTDILKVAIIKLWEGEPGFAQLLLSVHDEVVIELLDPSKEDEALAWIEKNMTEAVAEVLGEELAENVVDAKVARSWGEAA